MSECSIDIAHEGKIFKATISEKWVGPKSTVIIAKAKEPENYWLVQDFFLESGAQFDRVVSLQSGKNLEHHREILKGLHFIKDEKCKV